MSERSDKKRKEFESELLEEAQRYLEHPPKAFIRMRRKLEKMVNTSRAQISVISFGLKGKSHMESYQQHEELRKFSERLYFECVDSFERLGDAERHGKWPPDIVGCPGERELYQRHRWRVRLATVPTMNLMWLSDVVPGRMSIDGVLRLLPDWFWNEADLLWAWELSNDVEFCTRYVFGAVWDGKVKSDRIFTLMSASPPIQPELEPISALSPHRVATELWCENGVAGEEG